MSATSDNLRQDNGEVNIYYSSWPYSKNEPVISRYHMLFEFRQIQNNVEGRINAWLAAYERMAPAFNLYFGKAGQQALDVKFLTLAQGLEVYHRRTSDEKYMDEAEFDKLVKNLMDQCPEEKPQKWLEKAARYGNELSLRNRIERLIEPFEDVFGSKRIQKSLINKIVDTRNYLTHFDPCLESKVAKGADLLPLCHKMELLFKLHFLDLIGFSREDIDSLVRNCY